MRTVVVGAGPVGIYCAMALARRGEQVVVIDREAGPPAEGEWRRRGVMQFAHPHYFRQIVREVLLERLPDVWDGLLAAGGVPARFEGAPEFLTGLQCRRVTYERVVWAAAAREPGLIMRNGHVDDLRVDGGRVTGVVVDGVTVDADRVICATGRGSRLGDELRAPGVEDSCGFSYVARMYRGRPEAEWPSWPLSGEVYAGYQAILFPHDDRTLSALIVRPSSDAALADLRHADAFEMAAALIPQLAPWTAPGSFDPITEVMAGGRLTNGWRGQLDEHGDVPVAGVHFVGDAVCTTNPSTGRGVSLGLQQGQALLRFLESDVDPREVAKQLDAWCLERIKPWYDDHVFGDAALLRRLAGEDVDVEGPFPSYLYAEAAMAKPSLMPVVGMVMGMVTLPESLLAVEGDVREMLRSGWRPQFADGPTRDQIAERILQPA